jgi:hypothetical protein
MIEQSLLASCPYYNNFNINPSTILYIDKNEENYDLLDKNVNYIHILIKSSLKNTFSWETHETKKLSEIFYEMFFFKQNFLIRKL